MRTSKTLMSFKLRSTAYPPLHSPFITSSGIKFSRIQFSQRLRERKLIPMKTKSLLILLTWGRDPLLGGLESLALFLNGVSFSYPLPSYLDFPADPDQHTHPHFTSALLTCQDRSAFSPDHISLVRCHREWRIITKMPSCNHSVEMGCNRLIVKPLWSEICP